MKRLREVTSPGSDILEQARASDERIQNGTPKSLLDGNPVTIKANIAVGRYWEMPNACSSILTQDGDDNREVECNIDEELHERDF